MKHVELQHVGARESRALEKLALGVAQALIIGGIIWTLSGIGDLKTRVAVLESHVCHCNKTTNENTGLAAR